MGMGIVGIDETKFGKLSDSSSRELVADAFQEALTDAGLTRKDIPRLTVCSGNNNQRSPAGRCDRIPWFEDHMYTLSEAR